MKISYKFANEDVEIEASENWGNRFNHALECWDSELKQILQEFVTKIYANPDGSFSVEVGVHIDGAGGRTRVLARCTRVSRVSAFIP